MKTKPTLEVSYWDEPQSMYIRAFGDKLFTHVDGGINVMMLTLQDPEQPSSNIVVAKFPPGHLAWCRKYDSPKRLRKAKK